MRIFKEPEETASTEAILIDPEVEVLLLPLVKDTKPPISLNESPPINETLPLWSDPLDPADMTKLPDD